MVYPANINNPNFSQAGKNAYKIAEVDEYVKNVRQSYSKLYSDYKILFDKVSKMTPQVEEYNNIKNSIASALIVAETTAKEQVAEAQAKVEKLVSEAKENAESLYMQKKLEGEAYYDNKVSSAEEMVKLAQEEYDNLTARARHFSEKYIEDINSQANEIITDANKKAADIVAAAYIDAAKAKEKADAIISEANKQLNELRAESMKIKNELISLVSDAQQAAEKIENRIFEPVEAEEQTVDYDIAATEIDIGKIEKFTLDDAELDIPEEIEEQIVAEPVVAESAVSEPVSEPGFARFFSNNSTSATPFSGIFTSASPQGSVADDNSDNGANDIFADPPGRDNTRVFNPLKKDSE